MLKSLKVKIFDRDLNSSMKERLNQCEIRLKKNVRIFFLRTLHLVVFN